MKLVKFKYDGKHNPRTDFAFLFDTEQDVLTYIDDYAKLCTAEFQQAIKRMKSDMKHSTFVNICAHTGYTRVLQLATIKAYSDAKSDDTNILDVGIALDKILAEKKEDMLKAVNEGQIFCSINGGYGNYQQALSLQSNIEPFEIEELTPEQLHAYLWKLNQKTTPNYYDQFNVVVHQGKVFYGGLNHYSHDYLIQKHGLPWDNTLKLIIDLSSQNDLYGIKHLKLSNVYFNETPPFEPNAYELEQIENFIKELCYNRHKNN